MSRPSKKRSQRQPGEDEESAAKRLSLPPQLQSLAQRCHPDPLSLAFAFLTPYEMAAASGACRSWHAGAERSTAWPTFDASSLLPDLLDSPGYEPDCVRVALECLKDEGHSDEVLANLTQITRSRVWSQAHELSVTCCLDHPQPTATEDRALGLIAQMPRLQSLQVHLRNPSATAVRECFTALAPHLQCLSSVAIDVSRHVSLLSHLRVLELRSFKQTKEADVAKSAQLCAALRSLVELEYLHLDGVRIDWNLCLAVRELSVQRSLHSFSIQVRLEDYFGALDLRGLTLQSFDVVDSVGEDEDIVEQLIETELPPAALTFMRVKVHLLTGDSMDALFRLPQLNSLQVDEDHAFNGLELDEEENPLPEPEPSPLRSLTAPFTIGDSHLALVAARAPAIEGLFLNSMAPAGWSALAQLQSLCWLLLISDQQPFPTSAHFEILAALPRFERLILMQPEQRKAMLTSKHLQALSHSRSWSCIELYCPNREWFERDRTVTLPPSLSEADVQQLQQFVVCYKSDSAAVIEKEYFQLQPVGARGKMKWTAAAP